jgi:hypothetical protein
MLRRSLITLSSVIAAFAVLGGIQGQAQAQDVIFLTTASPSISIRMTARRSAAAHSHGPQQSICASPPRVNLALHDAGILRE